MTAAEREPVDQIRRHLEQEEDARLAPWALRSEHARRAVTLDREGRVFDYRTEFQRDRDRILHARAFRRLRLKSAGGALPPEERYRDRLTHSLALSQLSRTVARGLGLNEDLVEAIALGHELGTPPFARHGVAALDAVMRKAGGFRVSEQSLRVVDRLEKRYPHPGLNLTDAVREGILKQEGASGGPGELHPEWPPLFEAQVVAALEPAVSAIEDLDDGLRAQEVDLESVERLAVVRLLERRLAGPATGAPGRRRAGRAALHRRADTIHRGLSHMLVTGIIHASRRNLRAWARAHQVDTPAAFRAARERVAASTIGLTPAAARMYDALDDFVRRRLHQGGAHSAVGLRARRIVQGLFQVLCEEPRVVDDYVLLRFREETRGRYLRDVAPAEIETEIARRYRGNPVFARLVADHIAGMTDPFAVAEHERMVQP
ncbi:MAG: HD domain-containing protein [Candidatus Polarisedimenticolia bacterium]